MPNGDGSDVTWRRTPDERGSEEERSDMVMF